MCVCVSVCVRSSVTLWGWGGWEEGGWGGLCSIVSACPWWKVGLWLRPTLSVFRECDCLSASPSSLIPPPSLPFRCPPLPPLPLHPSHPHQVGLVAFKLLRACHIENISSFCSSFSSSSSRLTTRGPPVSFSSLLLLLFHVTLGARPFPPFPLLCTTAAL